MKTWLKILLIGLAVIFALWIIARLTGALQFYTCTSVGNCPTMKKGDLFFTSNLIKPKVFDFICFKDKMPEDDKEQSFVYRLCAVEGDILEIKDGNCYVNNLPIDGNLTLEHNYYIAKNDIERIKEYINVDADAYENQITDTIVLPIADAVIKHNNINSRRIILPATDVNSFIEQVYKKQWNTDNFGPIKIPANKYFVLGDSRGNAYDSRFRGLIDKSKIVGTVVGK